MNEANTAEATVAAPKVADSPSQLKSKPKTKNKSTPKPATSKKETVRVRALKALKNKSLTCLEIATAVGIKHGLKPTMDQEVERGHLKYAPNEDKGGVVVYALTSKGRTALEKGTVDPVRNKVAK